MNRLQIPLGPEVDAVLKLRAKRFKRTRITEAAWLIEWALRCLHRPEHYSPEGVYTGPPTSDSD